MKYINIIDNIIISLPILSEILAFFFHLQSVWGTLIPSPSRYLSQQKCKAKASVLSELWGMRRVRCPGVQEAQSRESRAGRAGRCSWLCGSCPSWSRAGDKWVMPLQNLNVDWHGGSPAFWLQGRMEFPHIWVKVWGVHGQADTLPSPSASDSPALPLQPPLSVWGSSQLLRCWQNVPCWWFNELWD